MKRTLLAASGAVVVPLTFALGGCSLFQRSSSDQTSTAPATVGGTGSPSDASSSAVSVHPSSAQPTATAPSNAPTLPRIPGYTLTTASPTVQKSFTAVMAQFRGVYSGLTVRNVMKGTRLTGTVVLMGLHPELVGNTKVEQNLVPGMVKGMTEKGATVKTQKINGANVAVAATKTTSIVAWYRSGTMVLMLANGSDPAESLAFGKAYLATS